MTTYKAKDCEVSWGEPERLIGIDPAFSDSSTWVMAEYLGEGQFKILDLPNLEGFEQVLGRKFRCQDCSRICPIANQMTHICYEFKLSDATKVEIKLKDREIEDTKIDTHPRYPLGTLKIVPIIRDSIFISSKICAIEFIPSPKIKLELIL